MSNKVKNSQELFGDKFRFSIVNKLSLRLILRLFSIFLSLDILIFIISGAALFIYSERTAASALDIAIKQGLPDYNAQEWIQFTGVGVKEPEGIFQGNKLPGIIRNTLPESTASGLRRFEFGSPGSLSFYDRLDSLEYKIELDYYGAKYEISVLLGTFLHYYKIAFTLLLLIELFILITRSFKDSSLVRHTLEPISELTKAAQILNKPDFDAAYMEDLAGKLEGINAARLDTRIQVNETQDELKNLAKAINSMLDRINESYRAQVRFVSDASHELRTPISVIQGYANLLDRWGKKDEKTLQESINAIKEEAANMKDLVEQLLFLARGDNNTIRLQIEDFNLSELISEVAGEMQMIDSAHYFEVRLSDASISADKALIKQALRILVDNSIKYTEPGGHITISSGKDGSNVKLSVQDDGIGILPEAVPKIFDRFYRTDESRARATGGAGLGLSIAKWITQRHSGHMEVLSREGIGTRITLVLPASEKGIQTPA